MTVIKFEPEYIRKAKERLNSMPKEDAEGILKMIAEMLLHEVEEGLNAEDATPGERPFFELVNQLYERECYFCDERVDPNASEFNLDVHLCMTCMCKLANALDAFGVDYSRLFPGLGPRKIQKTKFIGQNPTVCEICRQDIKEGTGCGVGVFTFPGDLLLRRVPYGEETRFGEGMNFPPDFCPECKVKSGQYHHWVCFWEECPNCHNQAASCHCGVDEDKTH